ncbi:glycosyltransferase family 2 protein [Acinetobacter ursingii]
MSTLRILLSLIVPVYGVENYIEKWMRSLCCQLTKQIEVIIVNDGTKDRSVEIIKDIIQELSEELKNCFVIIEQKNKGQSVARNNALDRVRGEFVGFLDPDDYVAENYIKEIILAINNNIEVDVIHINAKKVDEDGFCIGESLILADSNSIKKVNSDFLEVMANKDLWYPWMRIFNKRIAKVIKFPEGYILEDKLAFPEVYLRNIRNVLEINKIILFYRVRKTSTLNNLKIDLMLKSLMMGMNKYKAYKNCVFYTIIYHQYLCLFVYEVSILSFQDILRRYSEVKLYFNNRDIKLKQSMKVKIMLKFPIIFSILLKLKIKGVDK